MLPSSEHFMMSSPSPDFIVLILLFLPRTILLPAISESDFKVRSMFTLSETALAFIRKTIQGKNDLDIYKLNPYLYAQKTTTPGFFVHAMNDELIPLEHSLNLFEVYAGEKSLNVCEGTHKICNSFANLQQVCSCVI